MQGEAVDGLATEAQGAEQAAEPTQRRLDRYVLRHELGTGAMGSVWAAYDPKLMREVAVKVVAGKQQHNDKGRARFVREARAIAAIHHPNVVQIFDYSGLDSHTLYLVMEKLDGQDLWSLMHANQALGEAVAAAIGHELCLALEQAHAVGIIHRDLKPENVFLTDGGRVVLTDFGIVKAIADDAAVEGFAERTEVIGTPGFMAPELMRGKVLSPSTDIFALGALLYNIATLKMPFEGASPVAIFQAAQRGDFADPRQYQPQLSPEFCAVIAQCLQFAPRKRPRSAEAVRLMLRQVLSNLGTSELRDDLRAYMADPAAAALTGQRRAARHVLDRLRAAATENDPEAVRKLGARARVLDPFNDEVEHLVQRASAPRVRKEAPQGLTHLLSGVDWRFAGGERTSARPTAPLARAPRTRRTPKAGRPALMVASLAIGTVALATATLVAWTGTPAAPAPVAVAAPAADPYAVPAEAAPAAYAANEAAPAPVPADAEPDVEATDEPPAEVLDAGPAAAPALAHLDLAVAAPGRGAWLRLDGQGRGWVHVTRLALPPGRHLLELMARGGHRMRRWLVLAPGDERALHVDFTRALRSGGG